MTTQREKETFALLRKLVGSSDFPEITDPEEAVEWAKVKKILADAERTRSEAVRQRAQAVRQMVEVAKLLFKLKEDEREWVLKQLAQKLMLDYDEDHFLRVARQWPLRFALGVGDLITKKRPGMIPHVTTNGRRVAA